MNVLSDKYCVRFKNLGQLLRLAIEHRRKNYDLFFFVSVMFMECKVIKSYLISLFCISMKLGR